MPASEATWEPVNTIREVFPSFQLEDELFRQGERCYGGLDISEEEQAHRWLITRAASRGALGARSP
jgi:hypothetical protein